ncbi:MAG: c-type cytochrome [Acidobacteria bacterium]|nr:c-type cytochrome [Acidobacteriota bacterium]
MPFDPPPETPIGYYRDVARIFAFHCNGCHGEAGGLNLRGYSQAMAGGNKGKVIVAGDAENSLLIHFIEGRRGEAHRMPAGGAPLNKAQIAAIRLWIDQGAKEDGKSAQHLYRLDGLRVVPGKTTRISCRVPVQAYLVVTASDPATNRTLWTEEASIKSPKEQNDAAEPGTTIHWDIRPGPGWPAVIAIVVTLDYALAPPSDIGLTAELLDR